jgi:hypothetical protein
MEVAFRHQVSPDSMSHPFFEQHIVGNNNGSLATLFQCTVDMLKKHQLLVGGMMWKIHAARSRPSGAAPKGRIRKYKIWPRKPCHILS